MRKKFLTFEKMICQFRSVFDLSKDFFNVKDLQIFWQKIFDYFSTWVLSKLLFSATRYNKLTFGCFKKPSRWVEITTPTSNKTFSTSIVLLFWPSKYTKSVLQPKKILKSFQNVWQSMKTFENVLKSLLMDTFIAF